METSDGIVLKANVFRPKALGRFPVIVAMSPYGKDAHFKDAYKRQWDELKHIYPGIDRDGSTGKYLRWETADPERWVPHGYVLVHIDSRGSGQSPGYLDPRAPREVMDLYEAIAWAAKQPWSTGKVGMLGISYYAINQWQVASLQPPALKAIIPWEGSSNPYRDQRRHGGILSNRFPVNWWPNQVLPNQHGNAQTHYRDSETGKAPTGPALSQELLAGNRISPSDSLRSHPLEDEWFLQQSPKLERIRVPLLSAGNWGGLGLHMRGNIEGFLRAASKEKWLEMHGGTHFESFYLPEGVSMQMRFFDYYLKGQKNGWNKEPPVQLTIRKPGQFFKRMEREWPLARTRWTKFFLGADEKTLGRKNGSRGKLTYKGLGNGLVFSTKPFEEEVEFTGPIALRLWVSSSTRDMDIFATLRAFDPAGKEVVFSGASEAAVPITQGWLRVSHRKINASLSKPYRPYHSHDEVQPMTPGTVYPVDVEIWPTSIVLPKDYRLELLIEGKDFERAGATGRTKGSGPFLHDDPQDRDPAIYDGDNTLFMGGEHKSYLLMPLIPVATTKAAAKKKKT
ncbi:MAG TPA: CocE/NonD family hydrolase [Xanthobacteraceae bacterium]|nr:CocE/NonD family hydrolase [Xanthobacteraceae bacterium]